jgi:hypothetical protein
MAGIIGPEIPGCQALPGRPAAIPPHAPGQPGGAGAEAGGPAAAGVELADADEEAGGGGVEVCRQFGDLFAEAIHLRGGRSFHEQAPFGRGKLYTRIAGLPASLQDGRSRDDP